MVMKLWSSMRSTQHKLRYEPVKPQPGSTQAARPGPALDGTLYQGWRVLTVLSSTNVEVLPGH